MEPNLTKVAVALVKNNDGEVLIVKNRQKEVGKDEAQLIWQFPGGKIKQEETPEETVKRETLDQTGYQIIPKDIIDERKHPEFSVYIYYVASDIEGQEPQERKETTTDIAKWVRVQELENYFNSSIEDKVKEYLNG